MGAIRTQHLPNYTVADYRQWDGDWQLVEGIPFAMSPSANPLHQRFARDLLVFLHGHLVNHTECECEVMYELDLIVDEHTVLRPDLMIICHPFNDGYPAQAPGLITEVLSESTELMDRQVKKEIYQTFGVRNYWMADPTNRQIEFMVLQNEVYKISDRPGQILLDDCELKLEWSKLKART